MALMSARHTPGPWAQYEDDPYIIVDDKGSSLGEMVPGDPFISHDEAMANARLVAQAPELFFFTQQIFNGLDTGMLTMDTPADETLANVLARGRAALAKATGATSRTEPFT